MFRWTTIAILALTAVVTPEHGSTAVRVAAAAPVSLHPSITFVGGSADQRRTVLDAADRFAAAHLPLPDLEVRIRDGKDSCGGDMGRFVSTPTPTIDLCFDREFLALHELAHAWERFNVTDATRAEFVVFSLADAWRGDEIPHGHRGVERAADSIAFGLLSTPLAGSASCDRMLVGFELLTGEAPLRAGPPCERQ